ncbi:hypothetical protein F2Q70_00043353 [Brassica cretica]|uniref:Uncharacterized protein n=1 Tax=Brassica cretica TaxID=69181 RepID=A0A8S9KLQ3_BRACR|nr:hypothetical protein F2Q70_00043353 [Brassica cretica]
MPRDGSSVFSMFESMAHPSRRTVSPCSVANGNFIVVRRLKFGSYRYSEVSNAFFLVANSILPAIPKDLFAKRDLLRNGTFFWDSFTLDRIRSAVALYRSRGISRSLHASDMDEPHPDAVTDQRERVRPRKDKGIALEDINFVSEDLPLPGWNPGFTPGDGTGTSEAPLPDDFFTNLPPGFTTPASLDEASRREVVTEGSRLINEGMWFFNSTLDGSFRETRLSHFKAEEIERKFIRFQNEVAERERRQAESHSRALIRAERKGRRTIAAELARRATLFDAEFRSFKDAQVYVGDFRECRGSVGTLWKSQNADFSFLSEVAEMSGLMDGCAQAESMVPPIEGRIQELWEPIEVSEDTTEAGANAADEGGEADQPADSFGASISGGTSEAPLPDDFFANLPPGFTTPASLDEASRREMIAEGSRLINEGMRVSNSTLDGSFREARLSHFKAEEIERKFICFQNEVAERERRQAESHSRALICAERKGRRTIAAELARRATLFDAEFRSFKDAQDYVGDFRECCGLEPIEVLEDTTEAGADAADEVGEVDQPADSLGVSMSSFCDVLGEIIDLIRISSSLASLSALAAVDPSLILGQFFLLYTIEVFIFLCHGLFERRVLPSGLALRSSRMDVATSVRVIGLVVYVQINPLEMASFVAPGGRWKLKRAGRVNRQLDKAESKLNQLMIVWSYLTQSWIAHWS